MKRLVAWIAITLVATMLIGCASGSVISPDGFDGAPEQYEIYGSMDN